ncbi:MAG: hypothetical protein ACXW5U_01720 [Thermoanaerobaculia bacterium]
MRLPLLFARTDDDRRPALEEVVVDEWLLQPRHLGLEDENSTGFPSFVPPNG